MEEVNNGETSPGQAVEASLSMGQGNEASPNDTLSVPDQRSFEAPPEVEEKGQGEQVDVEALQLELKEARELAGAHAGRLKRYQNIDQNILNALESTPLEDQGALYQKLVTGNSNEDQNSTDVQQSDARGSEINWNDKQNVVDNFVEDPTGVIASMADNVFNHRIKQIREEIRQERKEEMDSRYGGIEEREEGIRQAEGREWLLGYAKENGVPDMKYDEKDPHFSEMTRLFNENPEFYRNIPDNRTSEYLFNDAKRNLDALQNKDELDIAKRTLASSPSSGGQGVKSSSFMEKTPFQQKAAIGKKEFLRRLSRQ